MTAAFFFRRGLKLPGKHPVSFFLQGSVFVFYIVCIGTVALLYPAGTVAQSKGIGSWNLINLKLSLNNKLSLFVEGQIRSLQFYNQFHYYEYKAGISYQFHKAAAITLGAGSYDTYAEGGNFVKPKNNDEFRIWPQLVVTQALGSFTIEQRYRSEFRFTSNGFRMRYRSRVAVAYSFGAAAGRSKKYQLALSNELFFAGRGPYFERNRLSLLLSKELSRLTTLQIGYLHQFDYRINDETGRDFLVVGALFKFTSKSKYQQNRRAKY